MPVLEGTANTVETFGYRGSLVPKYLINDYFLKNKLSYRNVDWVSVVEECIKKVSGEIAYGLMDRNLYLRSVGDCKIWQENAGIANYNTSVEICVICIVQKFKEPLGNDERWGYMDEARFRIGGLIGKTMYGTKYNIGEYGDLQKVSVIPVQETQYQIIKKTKCLS